VSQKAKRNEILELHAEPTRLQTEDTSANHAPSDEEIRRRAYEIYLERDGFGGSALDDWLRAETELRRAGLLGEAQGKKRGA
jgi:outer membrane protein TolC